MKYPDIFNPELSRVGVRHSQMYNVIAGILVTDMIKTALGPRGMEKMYIDIIGEETVTKHGGAFLRKLDVDHPAAKAIVDAVNTVDNHAGDGTASAAVLIGAMLREARKMRMDGISTAAIVRGFEIGMDYALDSLTKIRMQAESHHMQDLAATCLQGKALWDFLEHDMSIADIFVEAVRCVAGPNFGIGTAGINADDIKIEEKLGAADISLIKGTIIDKPIDSPVMPRAARNARILLLNEPLEAMRTRTESEIEITRTGLMSRFAGQEERDLIAMVEKIAASGADIVISRKGVSELAQERLARLGIISMRRVKYNDLWWLEKATGAKICKSLEEISDDELGYAERVREMNVGGDRMVFVESESPKSVTLLLRAGSKRYLDEFHRTALNAIRVLADFAQEPFIVYGGGSCEARIAGMVRKRALDIESREQIAVLRLADALEEIPATLARNLGMDTIDALAEIRSCAGSGWHGVDAGARRIIDMSQTGVIESSFVKRQVIKSAVEAVNAILGVDDVFVKDLIDNTHCHIDGTVHAHKDPGRNHNHWEQEGLEQRQMHHYY